MPPRRDIPLERLRNIGIAAHIDAGKTTVSERVLWHCGRIRAPGEVHHGTTQLDWTAQERRHGITITAAATTVAWAPRSGSRAGTEHRINLIDTPGHVDFTIEVERSLRVLDGAVAVLDAASGVESQTITVWRQADRYGVPRVAFVNKQDKPGADFAACLASMRERLGANPVAVQLPLGEGHEHRGAIDLLALRATVHDDSDREPSVTDVPDALLPAARRARSALVEACAEVDDAVLERFCARGPDAVPAEWLERALRKGTLARALVPVLCGSALRSRGVAALLDAVVAYLPSPADLPDVVGVDPATGERVTRAATDDAPLAALAFKLVHDPYVGHLTYVRVYSGTLAPGDAVLNATRGKRERVGRLVAMHANEQRAVERARAGDIVACVGLSGARTGDTLADEGAPVVLESLRVPEAVVQAAVEPRTRADHDRLSGALARLALEDPSFRLSVDEGTGQTVLHAMGELHLAILVERLRDDFGVEARTGAPGVAYRETVTGSARAEERYVRQTGGPGQFAHVVLEVAPAERGAGLVFDDASRGGSVPREFVPAVAKGVSGAMARGVLAGYPVVDVRVRLLDGSAHAVDSNAHAFELAGAFAFRAAARAAGLALLEPVMAAEVTTPGDFLGDVLGDLAQRRGTVRAVSARGRDEHVVDALVPLASTFGYVTELRNRTRGLASVALRFSHYDAVPAALRDALVQRA